jgi:hypothetical protein
MSFRFRRRLRLFPGLYLNVSKSGVSSRIDIAGLGTTNAKAFANSASAGGRGLTLNVSSKGSQATVGLSGSGYSYRTKRRPNRDQPQTNRHSCDATSA